MGAGYLQQYGGCVELLVGMKLTVETERLVWKWDAFRRLNVP